MEAFLTLIGNVISSRHWGLVVLYSFSAYGYLKSYIQLDFPLDYVLAIAFAGVFNVAVDKVYSWAEKADQWIMFAWRHSQLSDLQVIMLGIALEIDESWIHLVDASQRTSNVSDAMHGFLEADLAYMDIATLRFYSGYWKWLNKRRRKVLAEAELLASTREPELIKQIRRGPSPNAWMAE